MAGKAGKVFKYALSLALAAVLVWLAFRNVEWRAFADGLGQTRWGCILLFVLASVLALVFRMLRWRSMIAPMDPEVSNLQVWDADNVGNLANIALPGSGEFVRCGYVSSRKASYDKVFGTIALERVCDVIAIVVMFALALLVGGSRFAGFFSDNIWQPLSSKLNISLWWIAAALAALVALAVWAVFHFRTGNALCVRIAEAFKGLAKGFLVFTTMPGKWLFVLWTVCIWLMYILMSYTVLLAMPDLAGLGFTDALFISAVGNIASVIPVPGGIGAYHYLVALTLSSLYGAGWDTGILYATLCHELHAVLIIVLGIASYIRLTLHKKQ